MITYMVPFLVKHKRGNGPTGVGTVAGLTMDTNGGSADTELILSAGGSARRRRHLVVVMEEEVTGVFDGEQPANGVPYIPSQLGQ